MHLSRKQCRIEILTKFLTPRVSAENILATFSKIVLSPFLAAILNFCECAKMHLSRKRCEIVQFQAFNNNFKPPSPPPPPPPRYFQTLLATFPKNHYPAIFGGHLEFLHKTQKRIYLRNGLK